MYPTKLSFKTVEEIRHFHDKEYLKKLVTTKSALQNVLQDILERNTKDNSAMKSNIMNLPNANS